MNDDFFTHGPFFQPCLKRNRAIKRSKGQSYASAPEINRYDLNTTTATHHQVNEHLTKPLGKVNLTPKTFDETYVTEVCLGPSNDSINTLWRQNSENLYDWLKYVDERNDLFYVNLNKRLETPGFSKVLWNNDLKSSCNIKKDNSSTDHYSTLLFSLLNDTDPCRSIGFIPHIFGASYLSLNPSESNNDKEDVIYQFPSGKLKIVEIRGLFLTACQVIRDITKSSIQLSTLSINGYHLHVTYFVDDTHLFIFAVPAKLISTDYVICVMNDLVQVICIMFGSVSSAFQDSLNYPQLNQLFSITFHQLLQSNELYLPYDDFNMKIDFLPAPQFFSMQEKYQVCCDSVLSDFEAADFTYNDDEIMEMRRSYTVLGSCLYYKGMLASSHLCVEDTHDLWLVMKFHCIHLLTRESRAKEVILWHEIFLTRKNISFNIEHIGYKEPEARYFMLLVSQNNLLVATLLEAGGCAMRAEGYPSPSIFFIERLNEFLEDIKNSGLTAIFDDSLGNGHSDISISSGEEFLASCTSLSSNTTGKLKSLKKFASSGTLNDTKKSPAYSVQRERRLTLDNKSDGSVVSQKSSLSPSPNKSVSCLSLDSHDSTQISYNKFTNKNSSCATHEENGVNIIAEYRITSGSVNVLFNYLMWSNGAGVYVCPSVSQLEAASTIIHREITDNFVQCVNILHFNFLRNKNLQNIRSLFHESHKEASFIEEGVFFETSHSILNTKKDSSKKENPKFGYWVIGRRYNKAHPTEFYVCLHDSIPQNMAEIGFRLCQAVDFL